MPHVKLEAGKLYVASTQVPDKFLEVHQVIYHGIYEHDFNFITLLEVNHIPNVTVFPFVNKAYLKFGYSLMPNNTIAFKTRACPKSPFLEKSISKKYGLPFGMSIPYFYFAQA